MIDGRVNRMTPPYEVGVARPEDLSQLPLIELAAAKLLAGRAPESVLAEATSHDQFEGALRVGHLWVARADEVAVGFAHIELVETGVVHLKEIDVHPEHGRRGLGTRLVLSVCAWAQNMGYQEITLTTFRDVSWNMPFYAKLGFAEIPPQQLSPALVAILQHEAERGLDPARRVAMRRRLAV